MSRLRLMEDLEADDPIVSVVNLIDVFLVIIAALLLAVAVGWARLQLRAHTRAQVLAGLSLGAVVGLTFSAY